jgi:lipoprotein-anchoring transpeptidase ErfK/SrfK
MRRAAAWILVPILAAGCAGGSHERGAKEVSKQRVAGAETVAAPPPRERSSHAGRASRARAPRPTAVARGRAPLKPTSHRRALPWSEDGMSEVVHVRVPRVAVYRSPRAQRPLLVLRKTDARGTPRAFLVRATTRTWVRVYLPTRPNGSQGWVRRRAVRAYTNGYRLVIRLRAHRLGLWRGTKLLAAYPVAVGAPRTPTPRGLFYITELLKPYDPNGAYGPYSFGLSAHSNVLKSFAGGDGRVGLHGTNQPWLIGSSISHGCIRLRNAAIRRLAKLLPLGTPVVIRT